MTVSWLHRAATLSLRGLVAFGKFWYGFIIGDDWAVAAAVAAGPAVMVTKGFRGVAGGRRRWQSWVGRCAGAVGRAPGRAGSGAGQRRVRDGATADRARHRRAPDGQGRACCFGRLGAGGVVAWRATRRRAEQPRPPRNPNPPRHHAVS